MQEESYIFLTACTNLTKLQNKQLYDLHSSPRINSLNNGRSMQHVLGKRKRIQSWTGTLLNGGTNPELRIFLNGHLSLGVTQIMLLGLILTRGSKSVLVQKSEGQLLRARCQLIKGFVSLSTFENLTADDKIVLKCARS